MSQPGIIFSLPPRALFFDLMGTCADWHAALLPLLLKTPLPESQRSSFLLSWRAGFFEEIHRMFQEHSGGENIDVTHRRVLDRIVAARAGEVWSDEVRQELVRGWHVQRGWPDSKPGLDRLRSKFFLIVLANGTTRLQLDIVSSADLPFHTLLSSQLLGLTKPDPGIYHRALELTEVSAEEAVMVAAHAYDLRAAKAVGMKTIYVRRWTEDPGEDMAALRDEFDAFIEENEGLEGVARIIGV